MNLFDRLNNILKFNPVDNLKVQKDVPRQVVNALKLGVKAGLLVFSYAIIALLSSPIWTSSILLSLVVMFFFLPLFGLFLSSGAYLFWTLRSPYWEKMLILYIGIFVYGFLTSNSQIALLFVAGIIMYRVKLYSRRKKSNFVLN